MATPPEGQQTFPVQEAGTRPHRPSMSEPQADVLVDRNSGLVTATLSVSGKVGVSLAVYPDNFLPQTATQFTVTRGNDQTYAWDTTKTGGNYAFSVHGPDGFLASFAGAIAPGGQKAAKVPTVRVQLHGGQQPEVRLTLENDGKDRSPSASRPTTTQVSSRASPWLAGHKQTIHWPVNADGYYDVTVTADSGDGFLRRYAGRIS